MVRDMTEGHPLKRILSFSAPLLLGNLFQQFYSMADSIIVGQYIGRQRHGIAQQAAYRAWRISAVYAFCGVLVYMLLPGTLAEFFSPAQQSSVDFAEVSNICVGVLAAAALFNACDSIKFVFMGAMRGAGDTVAIFLLNSLTAWGLLVPGTLLLTLVFRASIYVVWTFVSLVCVIDAMIFLWRFQSGRWKKIKLISHTEAEPLDVEKAVYDRITS